jgi:AraC family ethanolamine operon transcriptional activator
MPGEDEFCLSSTDWHCWFVMVIPNEVMAQWSGDGAAAIMPYSRMIQIPSERAATLRRVVAQLGSIVQQAPSVFESSVVIDITARKLADSVREAIWGRPTTTAQPGRKTIPRKELVRTAMDCIDRRGGEYLAVTDLASAASVSERTLRSVFQEYFGMGPVRYLKLRTLNLARQALQDADPTVTTVTRVATEFGVWELGRFARDYQLLFGELPSQTLHRVR